MPNHPSDEQIKEWEEINFLRKTQSHQWFITTGQPLNLQHEIWLEGQEKLGSNGQLELLSVGLSEPNVHTNENTEPIPLEQEISQAPLEAGFISPQPQHGRLPAGETRDPSRSSIHVRPTQENVRRIIMLTPTCNTFGLLATLNAKVDQSYISKDAIHRIALERHIKKTQFPKYLKTQGGRCVNRRSRQDALDLSTVPQNNQDRILCCTFWFL
ncbi:hypothetical protein EYC84_009555 [Monilinia fructicola]|uniref:Uncharacterized protein n=1 Tax=Monilinia fructicola TaxID=38448 RepID=A0A5M9JBH1_MONFR|nr:hypothetical protein EYC84_009555 [Monilinia fructicola]